ncbi:hypothetical protein L6452_24887 [Arctium lappa]|uniref:Uncharacterized protein n=1 Tax=Arctium lappa TaxID=4217 RepID=A0ACB9AAV4_ARCLA|nr:hypothetical protein L6452_24887 [Arctium lappa]
MIVNGCCLRSSIITSQNPSPPSPLLSLNFLSLSLCFVKMVVKKQKVNTLILLLIASLLSIVAQSNKWVGSKYQIECTMCAACDNPCNQPTLSPPPPPPPSPPKPSPPTTPICPPPPSPTSGGGGGSSGGGGYYNPPPPTSQNPYYTYPPPPYNNNYPTPEPPNPIMPYFPYYYYSPPPPSSSVSIPGATALFLLNFILLLVF